MAYEDDRTTTAEDGDALVVLLFLIMAIGMVGRHSIGCTR